MPHSVGLRWGKVSETPYHSSSTHGRVYVYSSDGDDDVDGHIAGIPYEITTYTSNIRGAGTEADVYVVLYGRDMCTSKKSICPNKNDRKKLFNKGEVAKFVVEVLNADTLGTWIVTSSVVSFILNDDNDDETTTTMTTRTTKTTTTAGALVGLGGPSIFNLGHGGCKYS